jgi:predicted RecA/RadA family phage recombinase
MKNFVQPGHVITFTGPTGGALSGDLLIIGAVFGIASYNVSEGAEGELALGGVYNLPKATGAATEFQAAYWDATAKKVTTTATANTKIGVFVKAYVSGDTAADVRLNDTF